MKSPERIKVVATTWQKLNSPRGGQHTQPSMIRALWLCLLCLVMGVWQTSLHAAPASESQIKRAFAPCAACHHVGPAAQNQFGPQLNGVFQRTPGGAGDYDYSQAFRAAVDAGLVWDRENLDAFLRAPMEFLPGSKMVFPGVGDQQQRDILIDWLAAIGVDGELPAAASSAQKSKVPTSVPRADAVDVAVPEHGILHLGRVATDHEVAAWDIDVRPDGAGLPLGQGSVVDGGPLYDAQCAACHGDFGEGAGRWPVLAGGQDTLQDERPEKTIGSYWPYLSTVFDYVRRAMPFGNARSLSDNDVYAITAYLLYLNDLVEEEFTLSADNFAAVRLPNEAQFIADDRLAEPHYSTDGPCMSDCIAGVARVTHRAQVLDVTPDGE